jgi:hypothetical protein
MKTLQNVKHYLFFVFEMAEHDRKCCEHLIGVRYIDDELLDGDSSIMRRITFALQELDSRDHE